MLALIAFVSISLLHVQKLEHFCINELKKTVPGGIGLRMHIVNTTGLQKNYFSVGPMFNYLHKKIMKLFGVS